MRAAVVTLAASAALAGCTYLVADSIDNCRFETERFLGYTLWQKMLCIEDKEREPSRPELYDDGVVETDERAQ